MKEFIKSLAAELAPVWMTQQEPLKRDPKRSAATACSGSVLAESDNISSGTESDVAFRDLQFDFAPDCVSYTSRTIAKPRSAMAPLSNSAFLAQ